MTVHFGFACTDITPNSSVTLGGYVARTRKSEGVADPLQARVLSFREDEQRLVLVSLDLLGLPRREVDRLSVRLADLTGLLPGDFEFACTHTHAAPDVVPLTDSGNVSIEQEYLDRLPDRLAGAVREAVASEASLEASWARDDIEGVGASRLASATDGRPILPATVLNLNGAYVVEFACHPTVLGHDNLLVSGDLFGASRRSLEDRLGRPCVFLQGASADISTRSTRREQTVREVRRLGGLLADAVYGVRDRTEKPRPLSGLRVKRSTVDLPLKKSLEPEESRTREMEAKRRVSLASASTPHSELRAMQTALEGARMERRLAGNVGGADHRCPVFAARVGDIGFVGIGGELPFALGEEVVERSPFQPTLVLGCTGGYVGYLMGREVDAGGYEALASPYKPGAGEVIVERALDLLREIAGE